ncbi:MAG: type II toxin-antitoxin system Phd/YefM family antitoxin [Pyrinomonadaceae bacterium]
MKITRDIQTVSQFKLNASKLVKQIQKTKQPIVLTVHGKPAVVLQDAESFQEMASKHEYDLTVTAIKEALANFDDCDKWPTHKEVFSKLRKRNDIK